MSKQVLIEQDDRLFQGEVKNIQIDVVDSSGNPVNMTSYTLAWMLEELHDGVADLILKDTVSGIVVSDGAGTNSRATIALIAADTIDLEPRVYRHALWRTDEAAPQLIAGGSLLLQAGAELGGS